jgi:hypothetical protein
MRRNFQNYKDLFTAAKTNWSEHLPLWQDIAKIVAINVDPQYSNTHVNASKQADECIDDPTAAISVNQAGDYMWGIIWGDGNNAFSLVPSEEVKEAAELSGEDLTKYFEWRTRRLLNRMNNSSSGLSSAGKAYCYDQSAFGTSGIGAFPNRAFKEGIEDNIFIFRGYGVDGLIIDEGKNGLIEIIFVPYHWRVNRIVSEFCFEKGIVNEKRLAKMPQAIQDAYKSNELNKEFDIVHGIIPREDYDPKLMGKRGARYRGIWFLEDGADKPFFEEDYVKLPIGVCRAIKIRGDVYGRAGGTMLFSAIRGVNYIVGKVFEILEKQAAPALGMWGDAILGDKVLDSSAEGLTIFNPAFQSDKGGQPVFQLHDIGDPSNIIKFLIPYLNEKITTAFKIDILLDFNDKSSKTATEMLQRAVIRDRSLSGMLQQQRDECMNPIVHRCVSIEDGDGTGEINKKLFKDIANALIQNGKQERIIPESVLKARLEGKPWYQIKWNNALDKLSNTEKLEALLKILNVITALAAIFPDIIEAVDWYKFLADFKSCLCIQTTFMLTADEFKAKIQAKAQMQAQMLQLQAAQAGSQIQRNISGAKKDEATAKQTTEGAG